MKVRMIERKTRKDESYADKYRVKNIGFRNPEEMLTYIQDNYADIWSPDLEQYVFLYNDYGSIAYYDVDEDEAIELETKARESGDYWGAFLGAGGHICDTIEYQIEEQGASPDDEDLYDEALAYCEDHYNATWINCSDVI